MRDQLDATTLAGIKAHPPQATAPIVTKVCFNILSDVLPHYGADLTLSICIAVLARLAAENDLDDTAREVVAAAAKEIDAVLLNARMQHQQPANDPGNPS